MKNNIQNSKFSSYLKVSCSVLLLSGSLVGYGFTKDAFAQSENTHNVSEKVSSVQNKLDTTIAKAKTDINRLKHLDATELKSYKEDIEAAKTESEINKIVSDAKEEDQLSAEEDTTDHSKDNTSDKTTNASSAETTNTHATTNDNGNLEQLDKILADVDAFSKKVDTSQPNNAINSDEKSTSESTSTEQTNDVSKSVTDNKTSTAQNHDNNRSDLHNGQSSILDELDNVKNDVESAKQTHETSTDNNKLNEPTSTETHRSTEESSVQGTNDHSDNSVEKGIKQIGKSERQASQSNDTKVSNEDKHIDALTDKLSTNNKINQAISKVENQQGDSSQRYTDRKLEQLRNLRQQTQDNTDLTDQQKHEIKKDISTIRHNVQSNRDTIMNNLEKSSNKQQAAENILGSMFSKNEAQDILKNIKTNGQSDKQITDQIMKQLDGFKGTTSDDILKSMFEQAPNKEDLIKTLLSTRLGSNEASQIAKRLAHAHLSNDELVNRLKQEIKAHGTVSADDILKDVLDKSSNKKQTIETLLATKLNQAKAHALADLIAKAQTNKADTLELVKSALNGTAGDLLQLQNRLDNAKQNLDYILSPITQRPSLLDRINGQTGQGTNLLNQGSSLLDGLTGSGLLDGLNSGGSLLDNIGDIPNPVQGLSLGNLGNDDSFLSGLFDDDGNVSLPATGEAIKKSWLPITVILAIAGTTLVWLGRRKTHHSRH
ncbi:hypothetical protein HYI43_01595 [Staphylococcus taiwanensis]|nr:hypothetical protein HYI43_01595 [Staphylococcus taiwanensis]